MVMRMIDSWTQIQQGPMRHNQTEETLNLA